MDTLGVVESRSIAGGVILADGMVKAAQVELVRAATVCSGRYLILVSGDRQAVSTAVAFAQDSGRPLVGSFVISNVAPQLIAALKKGEPAGPGEAIGVVECRTVASGLSAADKAVKRASVCLCLLVTGQGILGKSYFVLSGDVASVEQACEAAKESLGRDCIETAVLPRPDAAVVRALTRA